MPVHTRSGDFVRTACFLQAKNLWVLSCDSAMVINPIPGRNNNNAIGGVIGIAMRVKLLELHQEWLETSIK